LRTVAAVTSAFDSAMRDAESTTWTTSIVGIGTEDAAPSAVGDSTSDGGTTSPTPPAVERMTSANRGRCHESIMRNLTPVQASRPSKRPRCRGCLTSAAASR
jgi:hypothetical protein